MARLLGVAALVVALVGCGGSKQTATTTTQPTTVPSAETTSVRVYLLRDGKVQPVLRRVAKTRAVAAAAWEELTHEPTPEEVGSGLSSAVAAQVAGTIAKTDAGDLSLTTTGQLARPALAQAVYTLTQFPTHLAVVVNGTRYTRADFEAETPAILVESPLPHQAAPSPIRVTGTANTFEATFQYELVDAAGTVIAKHFVTATSGSGTRGTFDVTIPYPAGHAGPGKLVVYENSAKDGARINVAKIPLRLTG